MNKNKFTLHDLIAFLRPDIYNLIFDGIRVYDKSGNDEFSKQMVILEGQ